MDPEGAWMVFAAGKGFVKRKEIKTACSGSQKNIKYWVRERCLGAAVHAHAKVSWCDLWL
jgi:hypothetical protein